MKFTEAITIHCTPEFAFDYTQDYNHRLSWDTFLKKAALVQKARQPAKGVKAYCVAKNGLGMVTEYITFNRPTATAIKMTKGPYMFKSFAGSWRFKAGRPGLTEVIFLYSFVLRFPFSLLEGVITNHLKSNVQQRLIDLKKNIEIQSQLANTV